ncbi:MAG: ThiF family adenylyltransferase [Candidatus Krumholzibacteriia bacterium]
MAGNPLFQRLQLLTGAPAIEHLGRSRAAVFGLGGVGSWAAEALVRSGVGHLTIVDNDVVCITNVNRQLQATTRNVGKGKADELKARLVTLNPRCKVEAVQKVYEPDTAAEFDLGSFDYVLDCIDSIANKVDLIMRSVAAGATLYSSMGAASKLDPTQIKVASVWETTGCPLARIIRQKLRAAKFTGDFLTVFSPEVLPPVESTSVACGTHQCFCPSFTPDDGTEHKDWCSTKKIINGSAVHITAVFGMMLAGLVVQDAVRRAPAEAAGLAEAPAGDGGLQTLE